MKVLSILNLSNRDNLGTDSGVIFHRLLASHLKKLKWKLHIASPCDLKIEYANNCYLELGYDKYDVRFRFEWDRFQVLVEDISPDVILCNQSELAANVRALLVASGNNHIKLCTYIHYIPIERIDNTGKIYWDKSLDNGSLAEIILLRILESLVVSDKLFVSSKYIEKIILRACKIYGFKNTQGKISKMPPPADPFFNKKRVHKIDKIQKSYVLYNSRMYEQYGADFILKLMSYYQDSGVFFKVCDFFKNKSERRKKLDPKGVWYYKQLKKLSNVDLDARGGDRKVYRDEIMTNAAFLLGPKRENSSWSMALTDGFGMAIPGLAYNAASYPEFVPKGLLYKDIGDAIAIIDRLRNDVTFYSSAMNACRENYLRLMPTDVFDIFTSAVKKL